MEPICDLLTKIFQFVFSPKVKKYEKIVCESKTKPIVQFNTISYIFKLKKGFVKSLFGFSSVNFRLVMVGKYSIASRSFSKIIL